MRQPYWVPLSAIRWGGRPSGGEQRKGDGLGHGLVFGGSWDVEDKQDIDDYLSQYIYSRTIFQLFRDGVPTQRCDQYAEMVAFVEQGNTDVWQARGCSTVAEVEAYFAQLRSVYAAIRDHGYLSQQQLGSEHWFDEIKVFVDRNGEIHKQQAAGHHRLAMARLLEVPQVPVVVLGVHREWALRMQQLHSTDVLNAIDLGLDAMTTKADSGNP